MDFESVEEWGYFVGIIKMYKDILTHSQKFDWSTKNFGSFFIKAVLAMSQGWDGIEELHKLFTIPNQNMSLLDIVHAYTIFDAETLTGNRYDHKLHTPPNGNDESHFQMCINHYFSELGNLYFSLSECLSIQDLIIYLGKYLYNFFRKRQKFFLLT